MDNIEVDRALHVAAIVFWIGGVAFVTLILLPAVRQLKDPGERLAFFDAIERRFAWLARIATLISGATGLHMIIALDLWGRFKSGAYWWMYGMVLIWFIFTMMLFVVEPIFLHRWLHEQMRVNPERTFNRIERMHRILLTLSLVTILGAVAGSHGLLLFE